MNKKVLLLIFLLFGVFLIAEFLIYKIYTPLDVNIEAAVVNSNAAITQTAVNNTISTEFSYSGGSNTNWIGLYKIGETDYKNKWLNWYYLNNIKSATPNLISSGAVTFNSISQGNYQTCYFLNNSYTKVSCTNTIIQPHQLFAISPNYCLLKRVINPDQYQETYKQFLDMLAEYKVNATRIFAYCDWEGAKFYAWDGGSGDNIGNVSSNYLTKLNEFITEAGNRGIKVILDLFQDNSEQSSSIINITKRSRSQIDAYVKKMVNGTKSHFNIIYETDNEIGPNELMSDGTKFQDFVFSKIKEYDSNAITSRYIGNGEDPYDPGVTCRSSQGANYKNLHTLKNTYQGICYQNDKKFIHSNDVPKLEQINDSQYKNIMKSAKDTGGNFEILIAWSKNDSGPGTLRNCTTGNDGQLGTISDIKCHWGEVLKYIRDSINSYVGDLKGVTNVLVNINNTISTEFSYNQGSSTNWIGLYKAGVTDYKNIRAIDWKYLGNTRNIPQNLIIAGTVTFDVVSQGDYQTCYFLNNSYTKVSCMNVKVGGAHLAIANNNISVPFSFNGGTNKNWVGLYKTGETNYSKWLDWYYLNNTKSAPPNLISSGVVTFSSIPQAKYRVCYLLNNGSTPQNCIELAVGGIVQTIVSGNTITADFSYNQGSNINWIGLYKSGVTNYQDWKYLNNKQQPIPTSLIQSGSVVFTNVSPGSYTIKYFLKTNDASSILINEKNVSIY